MPCDRTLGEYLAIATILANLIGNLFDHLHLQKKFPSASISKSVGLLVCFTRTNQTTFSNAVIGFGVTGLKEREEAIARRKSHLKALSAVGRHGEPWRPGSCAESETFAHIHDLHRGLRRLVNTEGQSQNQRPVDIISVSLTLNLEGTRGSRKSFCGQCMELERIIFEESSCRVIDLAPPQSR